MTLTLSEFADNAPRAVWATTVIGPILAVVALMFSNIFRMATIVKSPEPFFRQQLEFLGSSRPLHPPYTPTRILLNRSIARPLVRKESRLILFLRAFIIWCIGLGVPLPFQLRHNDTSLHHTGFFDSPRGNASLLLQHVVRESAPFNDLTTYKHPGASSSLEADGKAPCNPNQVQCSSAWYTIQNISILLSLPSSELGLAVTPVQGVLTTASGHQDILPDWLDTYSAILDGVPLVRGSNLVATFTWTQRDILAKAGGWSLLPPSTVSVYTPRIIGFQPFAGGGSQDANTVGLTLIQSIPDATRYFVDNPDSTVVNGIATVGGFWTFLNGTFALFFGANVLYFAFGRRPLSALGIVHVFQRGRLQRRPPGFRIRRHRRHLSANVSSIWERILAWTHTDGDLEPQILSGSDSTSSDGTETPPRKDLRLRVSARSTPSPSDITDEIPLLDVNIGLEDVRAESSERREC
ncbi:hypothetical protein C8R46DRAFT_1273924 [Mycena filopes]|nr:hypothetical protein C8R46DRAFT_1273924 [Mycena filopes]